MMGILGHWTFKSQFFYLLHILVWSQHISESNVIPVSNCLTSWSNSNSAKLEPSDTPAYHMVFRNASIQKYIHYIHTLLFISTSLSIMWFLCKFTDKSVSSNDFYLVWVYAWKAFGVYQASVTMMNLAGGKIRGRIFETCQSLFYENS